MILTEKLTVKIHNKNIDNYLSYYNDILIGDIIEIYPYQLPIGSHNKIDVRCDKCGKENNVEYRDFKKSGYDNTNYLCKKCKSLKNNNEKYGVDNVFQLKSVKDKSKITIKEKYGVDNISQSDLVKDKKEKTCIGKYGTKHHLQNKNILNKQKITVKEKYGVDNISQLDNIKEKKKDTVFKNYGVYYTHQSPIILQKVIGTNNLKYGVDHSFQNIEIIKKINETNLLKYGNEIVSKNDDIKLKISKQNIITKNEITINRDNNILDIDSHIITSKCDCGNNHNFKINRILYYKRRETGTIICTECNPINKNISGLELKLLNFIKENYDGEIISNTKSIINPYELDIYLPELNLAFEFNGIYWHNELNKPSNYHKIKSDLCEDKGIQLIHIWEDDWVYNQDKIKYFILNKLGETENKIYARKCEIKEINDNSLVRDFLNNSHLQGYTNSSIKLGLFYEDELVSLMTFKINNRLGKIELNRFCNKLNTNVIGGASKLFNYFLKNYDYDEIVSYADRSYSNGGLYKQLGFEYKHTSIQNYHYIVDGIRIHKSNFSKSILVKEGYDINRTEREIMLDRDIFRIYNSGNIKFIYKKKE